MFGYIKIIYIFVMSIRQKYLKLEIMTVATEIRNQIGNKALYMIGAKNLVGSENKLSFKVMRNSKGVTHVTVTLTPMDVYDVRFTACRGTSIKEKGLVEGVYCDQLNKAIEEATGLYTHL